MKRLLFFLPALLFTLLLGSCAKDELPVPPHDPGNVTEAAVSMSADYRWQLYYDLRTNTVVGQNLKTAWDLGFEATTDGFHVVLNSAKAMYAANTGSTDFTTVTDTIGFALLKKWDEPSGNLDSTAVGDWRGNMPVYIVDRGYSETGTHQGFRKIQFLAVDADSYTIRFAALNGNGDTTLEIAKDSTYNMQFLSFASGNTVLIEPPKADWDLTFTQYTHVFYNPLTTYLVTGCLMNRYQTTAARDTTTAFAAIRFSSIGSYVFSPAMNTIGYDWKTFNGSTYVTDPQKIYIIRDREGLYYKLHFIDFYDNQGIKGNPRWEFQQL